MAIHLINGPKEWRRTRGPINLATLRKAEGPFIKDVSNFPCFLNTYFPFSYPYKYVITYRISLNNVLP